MSRISYKRHRFPRAVIQHAVWLYFRFTLSFRDVEEMLAQRGIEVSYETDPLLDDEVRPEDRGQSAEAKGASFPAVASRRDGQHDRWRAGLHLARRR